MIASLLVGSSTFGKDPKSKYKRRLDDVSASKERGNRAKSKIPYYDLGNRDVSKLASLYANDPNNFIGSKIVPLVDRLPDEVLDVLGAYDSDKSKMLYNTLLLLDDDFNNDILGNDGEVGVMTGTYFGSGSYSEDDNFKLYPHAPADKHLIYLSDFDENEVSCFEIAVVALHEVFGHAYDNRDNELQETRLVSPYDSSRLFFDALNASMRSEFISYYEQFGFVDWVLNSSDPSALSMRDDAIEGYVQDKANDISAYREYRKAMNTGDWSNFKKVIIEKYLRMDNTSFNVNAFLNTLHGEDTCLDYVQQMTDELAIPDEPVWRSESVHFDSPETRMLIERRRLEMFLSR